MQQNALNFIAQAATVFAQGLPDTAALQGLKRIMDDLRAEDFDLVPKMSPLRVRDSWSSEEVGGDSNFACRLFTLPQELSIPFHSHPLMTVLMKVLWGSVRIKAYDWAEEYPWTGLARSAYDRTVDGGSETLLIQPKKGNIHRLQAVSDCVFLDVLAPPYSEPEGRPCHYYREDKEFTIHGETLTRLVRE
jgi:2-aminoethanethiol dioxygenase/cysteine oxidase family protein